MPNSALTRTVRVVTAYLAANKCPQTDVPTLIERVHAAFTRTPAPSKTLAPPALTAKQIAASITPDFLISFERGLPNSYPMTAANYSRLRSKLAKQAGLGRKRRA